MLVTFHNTKFKVIFSHSQSRTPAFGTTAGNTLCEIRILDTTKGISTTLYKGRAICQIGDQYCKETGRKIALKRALENINNRDMRRAFWQAYHSRPGSKVTVKR